MLSEKQQQISKGKKKKKKNKAVGKAHTVAWETEKPVLPQCCRMHSLEGREAKGEQFSRNSTKGKGIKFEEGRVKNRIVIHFQLLLITGSQG